jgi:hypothetical protein
MNNNTLAKKILILAANPKQSSRLRLDEEVRDIKEGCGYRNEAHLRGLQDLLAHEGGLSPCSPRLI